MELDMAKLRSVNTHFWHDEYIGDLLPHEKLLFLYLLTCPLCNIAGVYEVTVRQMAFDTGLLVDEVKGILAKFEQDGKVRYINSYVILVNHHKNQKLNTNMERARLALIKELPPPVLQAFQSIPNPSEAFESITESFVQDKDKDKDKDKDEERLATLAERAQKFKDSIFTSENIKKYGEPMLANFFIYWSETTRSMKKMRHELQPTWKLSGRLATWAGREITKGSGKPTNRIYHEE